MTAPLDEFPSYQTPARKYAPGIGDAVADRTINRKKADGTRETWEEVAHRVSIGNALLAAPEHQKFEFNALHHHMRQASVLMSGRHLQHGDVTQPSRNMEIFTNCGHADTKLLTAEYGITTLGEVSGQTVTVRCADGEWRPALASAHGEQQLFRLVFRRVGPGPATRREERFTRNHRWILSDGIVTEDIQPGDRLLAMPTAPVTDMEAVVHGLIFGDGTGHKTRSDTYRTGVSYGRTYASIRVCKADAVREQIHSIFDDAGYRFTTPPHAGGDRVYYLGKYPFAKELPCTTDGEYIAGFLQGWWLADGSKTEANGTKTISTSNETAAHWLVEHAPFAGLVTVSCIKKERKEGDGSFANGKPLYVIRMREKVEWALESIEPLGEEIVYCVEEPITRSFTLASGIVTGNCATSASTFLSFYLLLNGSGVGRAYDDAMIKADLNNLPVIIPVIDMSHADCSSGEIKIIDRRTAEHIYGKEGVTVFDVPDSREGWAQAIELLEVMAWEGTNRDEVLVIDFSQVRPRGSPIGGMQGRPASGPGPLIAAIQNIAGLREAHMAPWRAAMYADHYVSECVLVGGARRAARMATKFWKDKTVLDFINVKRGGFLWSSNNSVTVDGEFWEGVRAVEEALAIMSISDPILVQERIESLVKKKVLTGLEVHAHRVFTAITQASYFDGTGEPGLINVDRMSWDDEGVEVLYDGNFAESSRYKLSRRAKKMNAGLVKAWKKCQYKVITNPCVPGDTPILTREGYVPILETIGKEVEVWNGKEFSKVTPFSTGFNPTSIVKLSNGVELRCTPAHKWVLAGDRYNPEGERVETKDLQIGAKLAKYTMPVVEAGTSFGSNDEAYSQGFYSGDGTTDLNHSWLYSTKFSCESRLVGKVSDVHNASDRKTWAHGPMKSKSWVPIKGDFSYCMNWLAGLLDSDGTVLTDVEGGQNFQIAAIDKAFLQGTRLMLSRLGVQAKVRFNKAGGRKMMPDGKGGQKEHECQDLYRLLICGYDAWRLVNDLGLKLSRLSYTAAKPNRSAAQFVTVEDIVPAEPCLTYCFTEPKNHTGTFNGVVTAQCGEIVLNMLGGYCTIADIVPFHAGQAWRYTQDAAAEKEWDDDAEDAFRTAARALIRVNQMDSLYSKEVARTNRIGVGMTGLHEYAWARFKFGWKDLVQEEASLPFWQMLSRFSNAVVDEAKLYSLTLGMAEPHTSTTEKPAGTTSKLFGLTEGAHLPSMREYVRWVQFRNDDPLIQEYEAKGYPTKKLKVYSGSTIVGFPTTPAICTLGMGDALVTAAEATPEEQYQYLRLLEKYWINGYKDGKEHTHGNQVSYTLKYLPERVSYEDFKRTLLEGQSTIKCCSVMPQGDMTAYEYQPEQPVTKHEYEQIVASIKEQASKEDIGFEHVDCANGICPIDFDKNG